MPILNLSSQVGYPISPDIEDRRGNQSTTPPLLDRINARIAQIQQQLMMTKTGILNHWNPYADQQAQDARDLAAGQQMYVPGQDAASLTPQQAAIIRARVGQRFQ